MPFNVNPQNSAVEYTSGEPFYNVLAADQTVVSSTTVVAVPTLQFQLAKFQRVQFDVELYFTSVAAAGFRYRFSVPQTPTLYRAIREHIAPDALTAIVAALDTANDGVTDRTITHASGTDGAVRMTGIIQNGSTAGAVQLSFAQNASNAGSTIIRAGSFVTGVYV
jgi:hypothetical protein